MFKLANKYTVDRPLPKCDHFRWTPGLSFVIFLNKQSYMDIFGEDGAISLRVSFPELESDFEHEAAGNNEYANGDHLSQFRSDCYF